jgi:hypothetical protein
LRHGGQKKKDDKKLFHVAGMNPNLAKMGLSLCITENQLHEKDFFLDARISMLQYFFWTTIASLQSQL